MSDVNDRAVPHPIGLFAHTVLAASKSSQAKGFEVVGIYLDKASAEAHARRIVDEYRAVLVAEAHQFSLLFGDCETLKRISDDHPFYVNQTGLGFGREVVIGVWSNLEDALASVGRVTTTGPRLMYRVGTLVEQNLAA